MKMRRPVARTRGTHSGRLARHDGVLRALQVSTFSWADSPWAEIIAPAWPFAPLNGSSPPSRPCAIKDAAPLRKSTGWHDTTIPEAIKPCEPLEGSSPDDRDQYRCRRPRRHRPPRFPPPNCPPLRSAWTSLVCLVPPSTGQPLPTKAPYDARHRAARGPERSHPAASNTPTSFVGSKASQARR
ncbi:hypothetical protein LPU83_pLPU83d_0611 (plasmid) [Rhizobium favelukesii]|uniref:Uncharacterized protein n=1 Tax=Rhizobium favelukesii TaxID=348824 RepID=W6RLK5_9HYPH|nr:hypothetical protein LPU83_pLPU83d_0611 [Rhizobium favelukesii]